VRCLRTRGPRHRDTKSPTQRNSEKRSRFEKFLLGSKPTRVAASLPAWGRSYLNAALGLLSQTGGLVILAFRQNEGIPVKDFDQTAVDGSSSSDVTSAAGSQSNHLRAVLSAHRQSTSLKLPSALRADCSSCAGLCCVVHPFYAVQGFAFDKAANSACRYLAFKNRCAIHNKLAPRGFPVARGVPGDVEQRLH
jgi:hypothetical protein